MVIKLNITIRGINSQFWRDFKAEAIREGLHLGEALNLALKNFLEELRMKKEKKQKDFFDLEPISDKGKDAGRVSVRVDEILYGWKK